MGGRHGLESGSVVVSFRSSLSQRKEVADSKTVFAYIGIGCIVVVGVMVIGAGACGVWGDRGRDASTDPNVAG